jgi:glucose-6-phosphate isomerase
MQNTPFTSGVDLSKATLDHYDNHIVRRLSDMKAQYADQAACETMLEKEDIVLYEVYAIDRPATPGELSHGLSVVHPGTVGDEFFMTKGHYHAVLETAEVYYCLKGQGVMVMETPEGDCVIEELRPGKALYVPPRWAHRSVNTGHDEDLVTFYVYPGDAGHDYGTIETQGFRKLVMHRDGAVVYEDNPRWLPPEARR